MSERKAERLINLTIALMVSKRYLDKSEIFRDVAGYEGSSETMERMFERDKDELRNLGIDIEVGTHDAFFEDEVGYRITRDSYGLNLGELSAEDLAYISLAGKLWRDETLTYAGTRALAKIDGSELFNDPGELGATILIDDTSSQHFEPILGAIDTRSRISFTYESTKISQRHVEPYELTLWHGFWYLIGNDIEKGEIRVFKLKRISGSIEVVKKKSAYEIPAGFDSRPHLTAMIPTQTYLCALKIRKSRAHTLRARGSVTPLDETWDLIEFHDADLYTLASQVLWHVDDVIAVEPQELRELAIRRLKEKLS